MVRPATEQEILETERKRQIAEWMEAQAQAAAERQLQEAFERMGEKIRANPDNYLKPDPLKATLRLKREQIRANPEKYLNPDPSKATLRLKPKAEPAPEPERELRPVILILL